MRILLLSHYFPPEVNAPASRTYEHARRWVKAGVKVTIITNYPNHPHGVLYTGYKNRFISYEVVEGIQVIRVKTFLTPNAGVSRRIISYLFYALMAFTASRLVRRFDVVIATSPQLFCGLSGAFVSKLRHKPFVLEIRDLWPESIIALNVIRNNRVIRFLQYLERWMYFAADRIITTSEPLKQHIVKTGYPPSKAATVMNSVDTQIFHPGTHWQDWMSRFDGKFIACYAGTFGMAHGLEVILEAAKILDNEAGIHFILVGDGAERPSLIRKAEDLKLKNLTILPLLQKEDIVSLLAMVDLGIVTIRNIPVFQTAVPSKMFEYAALKKPVILATGQVEGAKIVEKYNFGLVIEPEDSAGLKEAILKLYNNEDLREKLGENGLRAVKQHYNRDIMAAKMLRMIFPSHDESEDVAAIPHG